MIASIVFIILLSAGVALFTLNVRKVIRNIRLGKELDRTDRPAERMGIMARVALGQSKMVRRPIPAILHIFVYVGFVIINIEVIEMFVDGIFGTHRFLSISGNLYSGLIACLEVLGFLVTFGCVVFLIRRNIVHVKRLVMKELDGWPKTDANVILIAEILLMTAFFTMNACDAILFERGNAHYNVGYAHPISQFLIPLFDGLSDGRLVLIERFCWWFHIVGILAFLNYLPYSKHFHILLAFPNVYYSNLKPKGEFSNLQSVTNEVKAMMDPSFVPPPADPDVPMRFGAKDVTDLNWKQLLDAYTCTECGRCTSACPANITGKLLSPRKIMMDTRDRLVEVGKNLDANKGEFKDDGKSLLGNYITAEELWACTSCNACVQECPVNIDPLSIIVDMRRYMVMEQSAAPTELNGMFSNTENNGAPWQFSPADRLNWAKE
jgi:ferredoxin